MEKIKKLFASKPDILSGNIYKTVLLLGAPIMLSHFIQTLYSMTDAFWLGKVGRAALIAPSITFNLIFVILAFAGGLAGAGLTMVGQRKGAKEADMVNRISENTILVVLIFASLLAGLGFAFSSQILSLLNTPPDAFKETQTYLRITCLGVPFVFGYYIFQGLMQGYGDTVTPLKLSAMTVLLNMLLDPLLIFGLKPIIPPMGVAGAAIATIFSESLSASIGIYMLHTGRYGIKTSFKNFRFDFSIVKEMVKIGVPMSLSQIGTALGFAVLMGFVNSYGSAVAGAYGVGNRVLNMLMVPAIAFQVACTAMIAQNIGAGQVKRVTEIVWKTVLINFAVVLTMSTILFFFGSFITRLFINDSEIIKIGDSFFKIISYSMLLVSMMGIFLAPYQGSGNTLTILYMEILRLWFLRIPIVFLVSKIMGYQGIFWGIFISNIITIAVAYAVFKSGKWKKNTERFVLQAPALKGEDGAS
ncbi:MAG: MATE family efflux transporter [bacterium]|nr:MATE family efflux transporter [bacterium]